MRPSRRCTLIRSATEYESLSHRFLLRSLLTPISADIAAVAPAGTKVLDVGCGPGHLATRLALEYRLDVTGVDLDPDMIELARAGAEGARASGIAVEDVVMPRFLEADAAALPFADGSFDLVVSTLSMHHWQDQPAGLLEISRVLKSGGRALIWDFRPGWVPFHAPAPDLVTQLDDFSLRVVSAEPWRSPWRFTLLRQAGGSLGNGVGQSLCCAPIAARPRSARTGSTVWGKPGSHVRTRVEAGPPATRCQGPHGPGRPGPTGRRSGIDGPGPVPGS